MMTRLLRATLSVSDLQAACRFYGNTLGLSLSVPTTIDATTVASYWRRTEAPARAVLATAPSRSQGQILLIDFNSDGIVPRHSIGLWNLNFYTCDLSRSAADLARQGYRAWSDPIEYDLSESTGSPREIFVDGPDGLPINVVEPVAAPGTLIADVRHLLDTRGTTPAGFTEVVTTGVRVSSMDEALPFYRDGLGLSVWLDQTVSQVQFNRLMWLPDDARTRVIFLRGPDLFGKVALVEAQNYPVKRRLGAPSPGVGYLALGFAVDDTPETMRRCLAAGGAIWSPLHSDGEISSVLLVSPGEEALIELISSTD